MASKSVSTEELLVSSLATNDALAKVAHRKGHYHAARVFGKDFGREGDESADALSDAAITIGKTMCQIEDEDIGRLWTQHYPKRMAI